MIDYKQPFIEEIRKISEDFKVDFSILKDLVGLLDEQLAWSEWDESRFLITQPEDYKERSNDLAILTLFLNENKSSIESENPQIFEKVVFTPINRPKEQLRLSKYYANLIFKTFVKHHFSKNEHLSIEVAKLKLERKKPGKRQKQTIGERNELIKTAANYLKKAKVLQYSEIICELLSIMDIKKDLKPGNVRQIIHRS